MIDFLASEFGLSIGESAFVMPDSAQIFRIQGGLAGGRFRSIIVPGVPADDRPAQLAARRWGIQIWTLTTCIRGG